MRATKENGFNIDGLVNIIRGSYCEEDADSVRRAVKAEVVWTLIKLLSCLAVIALALYCSVVVDGPFWRLAASITLMLACFCAHCFATHRLGEPENIKNTLEVN